MNILFAASEMVPFCKTGGLADVIGALPPALVRLGHQVTVMLPGYSVIDRVKYGFKDIDCKLVSVPVGFKAPLLRLSKTLLDGVTVYLLENEEYYDRPGLYGDEQGDYEDNGQRFIFYARGVVELIKVLDINPDVVHAHDWQGGLVVAYLATLYRYETRFKKITTLFTIHNVGYQGVFPQVIFSLTDIPREEYTWRKMEYWGKVSFLKSGIVYADAISTVSERYADEITRLPLGFGMEGILAERRHKLFGIVNGIDDKDWDPSTDSVLPSQYAVDDLSGKHKCRDALLKKCGLKASATIPVFGMVTRLDSQKGLDILEEAMGRLAAMDIRIILLGAGAAEHQDTMRELAERYNDRLHVTIGFDNEYAKLIYGGVDGFLMPSRYEPCGLGQLIAMRYGALPVVHETGGLADTVTDINLYPTEGNGFTFPAYTAESLIDAVARAVNTFREPDKKHWKIGMINAMSSDYSWDISAKKYVQLYSDTGNRIIR